MGWNGRGRAQIHGSTSDYLRLDVRWLKRQGYLRPGWSNSVSWSRRGERIGWITVDAAEGHVRLRYKNRVRGEEWVDRNYQVSLEWVPCHFGGSRVWFRCPCCLRRAAILYGEKVFACRHCLRLVYESQREVPHYRALSKAQAIHEKLGGSGVIDDWVFKPKGMHQKTFNRYLRRLEEARSRAVPPWLFKYVH
jgi:hypothetical protein